MKTVKRLSSKSWMKKTSKADLADPGSIGGEKSGRAGEENIRTLLEGENSENESRHALESQLSGQTPSAPQAEHGDEGGDSAETDVPEDRFNIEDHDDHQ